MSGFFFRLRVPSAFFCRLNMRRKRGEFSGAKCVWSNAPNTGFVTRALANFTSGATFFRFLFFFTGGLTWLSSSSSEHRSNLRLREVADDQQLEELPLEFHRDKVLLALLALLALLLLLEIEGGVVNPSISVGC